MMPPKITDHSNTGMPAFGSLTGGMDAADKVILSAMQPARAINALLAAGDRLVEYPLWRGITQKQPEQCRY